MNDNIGNTTQPTTRTAPTTRLEIPAGEVIYIHGYPAVLRCDAMVDVDSVRAGFIKAHMQLQRAVDGVSDR